MAIRLAARIGRIRPSPTVSITARAARLREQGRNVIALSVGEPDFDTPEHVKAAARDALARGETKYTPVDGSRRLKEAVVAKFKRENGLEYAAEQVLISSGAKQSCYNACLALLQAGDEAIVAAPYWVSYTDMVRMADATPVVIDTTPAQRFKMTAAQLAGAITSRTRLVILNSPCNPTGAVYSRTELAALGAVLREHREIVVLTDDIYEHIHWADEPLSSFAAVCPELYDRTITVNGVSKSYAMTGWRVGYAAGPAAVIKAMTTIQSQSTTNASSISQAAAAAALEGDQTLVRERSEIFRNRHALVLERLRRIRGFECWPADGAFYAFPRIVEAMRIKGAADDTTFCEQLLGTTDVALVPGSAFGAPGYLRMSFAASMETLEEALSRIERFMR